jgi:hypothetical protein
MHGNWSGNWNGQHGNWYGRHDWDNYYARGGWGRWGGGGYWPWYGGLGLGWGLGWDWGYPYDYGYDYPYSDNGYFYSYAPTIYYDNSGLVDSGLTSPPIVTSSDNMPLASTDNQQGDNEGLEFYSQARAAFQEGDYRNALRLAEHAGIDSPGNAKVHELISLTLFALGNYSPAASEAHAAMALGTIAEWKDLYAYYNDVNKYTTQLRALEKAVADHPNSAADHYLLAYQYLMTGAQSNAESELAVAAKLTPADKLAAYYLHELQSHSPLTPPPQTAAKTAGPSAPISR